MRRFKASLATGALVILAMTSLTGPASASTVDTVGKTIVVIDSGFDASNALVAPRVLGEVCILSFNVCPNGKNFMEGPGSAVVPAISLTRPDFYHGTQMSSIILAENSDAQIIMIRVVANTPSGAKASTNPAVIGRALTWASENASKYNIVAVSASMGMPQAVGKCAGDETFNKALDSLVAKQIPFFAATGNAYSYNKVDWPACDSRVTSVGALDVGAKTFNPALYSNYIPTVDYFANGKLKVINSSGKWELKVGTSAATAAVVSKYYKLSRTNPSWTPSQVMAKMDSQIFPAYSAKNTGRYEVRALDLRAF